MAIFVVLVIYITKYGRQTDGDQRSIWFLVFGRLVKMKQHNISTNLQYRFNTGNVRTGRIGRNAEYLLDVLCKFFCLLVVRHLQLFFFSVLLDAGILESKALSN